MRRFLSALVIATAVVTPLAAAQPASAAKAGQLCKGADEGKKQDGLTCTKDGTRFRWAGGAAAATKAPTTKKAAATTKKASTTDTKAAATTKKSSGSSGASSGGGEAVKGRFCAKADDGRKATDAKGRKLTCKADAAGKNRWQE
jgi:hypothetical protein